MLPSGRWPSFFSRVVARLQWDASSIDLVPDAGAWPELPDERRERLTTLLAGFRVAEDAVAEHLTPFGEAANNSLVAWVLFLQRRDEQRHAMFFDRIAAEVLELPGDTQDERRDAAREHAPAGVLELFEERCPRWPASSRRAAPASSDGIGLYHMILEGIVLAAGQHALLADLEDDALPGVREGVQRVELDERWHIGFGLRCLIEAQPSAEVVDDILATAEEAAAAWGDASRARSARRSRPCAAAGWRSRKLLDSHAGGSLGALAELDLLRAVHPQVVEHAAARLLQAQAVDQRRVAAAREAVRQQRRAARRALDRERGADGRDALQALGEPAEEPGHRGQPAGHEHLAGRGHRRGQGEHRLDRSLLEREPAVAGARIVPQPLQRAGRPRSSAPSGSSAPPLKTVRFESAPPMR